MLQDVIVLSKVIVKNTICGTLESFKKYSWKFTFQDLWVSNNIFWSYSNFRVPIKIYLFLNFTFQDLKKVLKNPRFSMVNPLIKYFLYPRLNIWAFFQKKSNENLGLWTCVLPKIISNKFRFLYLWWNILFKSTSQDLGVLPEIFL